MAPRARLTAALAGMAAAGLLANWTLAELGHDTVLRHTARFLAAEQGFDSWAPMAKAYDYVIADPIRPLYDWLFFEQKVKFIYPPTSLLVIDALDATLPRLEWRRALVAVSWLLVVVTGVLCAAILERALPPGGLDDERAEAPSLRIARMAVVAALALTFYPVIKAYSLGQAQVFANAGLAGLIYAWQRGHQRTAGVLVALMAAIKPQYALIGAWGLLRHQWTFAGSAFVAGISLLALSLARYGVSHHLDYLEVLKHIAPLGEVFHPNQTVNGLLNRLLETGDATRWSWNVYPTPNAVVRFGTLGSSAALLLAALFAPTRGAERAGVVDVCAIALAVTMASPIAWEHHYGILLPILAVLLARALAPLRPRLLVGLALAYTVAANYIDAVTHTNGPVPALLQSGLLFAAVAVFVVLLVERARAPAPAPATASSGRPDRAGDELLDAERVTDPSDTRDPA